MALERLQNGRYRRLRFLGSGSMGEVILVEDTRINRQVAIKVIRSEASPYPGSDEARDAARLFQREARAIAALDHPNILPLYDFGEEDLHGTTLTYMVMPFCPEGSFADWLRQRGSSPLLSPQDVAYFVEQAAEALQYAHDHQTLHLDVKPSNLLLRTNTRNPSRPILLLADFGVARLSATTSNASRTIRGTPIAMAPEQWSGSPVAASDQYALAVMTYQLLVGRPPFQGGLEQLMYQHFHVQPQPPSTLKPHLSGAIDAVVLRALAKKPEERYPSISAFANALGQTVQTLPTEPDIRSQQADDSDIRATLAISKAEALNGTIRTLTLPAGRRVTVTVPPGAYDGQVIRLQNLGEPSRSGGSAGALILTIALQQTSEMHLEITQVPLVEIFYSYAHEDEPLRNELEKHLSLLKRQGRVDVWFDRNISAGTEWAQEINTHLNTASIILLLISPDFMSSDYCYSIEMKRALERHNAWEARVIPIILRPVDWQSAPFGKLQALPPNGRPITTWNDRDSAFFEVTMGIREAIQAYLRKALPPRLPPSNPSIGRTKTTLDMWNNVGAVGPLIMALVTAQQWEQAEAQIRAIPDSQSRARALAIFTKALIEAQQWTRAEAVARSIEDSGRKAGLLSDLSRELAQAQEWGRAEDVARSIAGDRSRAEALEELGRMLIQAGELGRAREVFRAASEISVPLESRQQSTVAAAISSAQEPTSIGSYVPSAQSIPSVQGVPTLPSTSRRITPSRTPLSKWKIILLIGLALLVIVSGILLFFIAHANQVVIDNANTTAVANAHATATKAAINATGTALWNGITATLAKETATTASLQNTYNNATRGTPTLDDPLSDNSKGYSWTDGNNNVGGTCAFTGGAYHASQSNSNYFNYCTASTNFSNFVFEVQMKIVKGDSGGVIFRADTSSNKFYVFYVDQDGSYQLALCSGTTCNSPLISSTSSAIKQGLNQTNLIAVIAQGSSIGLYVNHQFIDSVDDSTYKSGQIGVIASPYTSGNPTEVAYNNAKVWIV